MKNTQGVNLTSFCDTAYWLTHPEFRAFATAMRDNPEDDMPRLVAVDWLQDRGDLAALAYAEFIRESLRCPRRLSRKAEALLDVNLRAWVEPLLTGGKQPQLEVLERKGSFVNLRLAFTRYEGGPLDTVSVQLRWRRGFVESAEFGPTSLSSCNWRPVEVLAPRVAIACPAVVIVPTKSTGHWWLKRQIQPAQEGHDLTLHWGAAELFPWFGPSDRVVASGLGWREAIEAIPRYMQAPMTQYAHNLASAALQPAPLVA